MKKLFRKFYKRLKAVSFAALTVAETPSMIDQQCSNLETSSSAPSIVELPFSDSGKTSQIDSYRLLQQSLVEKHLGMMREDFYRRIGYVFEDLVRFEIDLENKQLLDIGCCLGNGLIASAQLGAALSVGLDRDFN